MGRSLKRIDPGARSGSRGPDQARMDKEVGPRWPGFRDLIELLDHDPRGEPLSALTLLSEIGLDMNRFPDAGHLVAWAGLCPGQNESAGKRKSVAPTQRAPWLKTMLVQCAWAAKRTKDSYYRAQFFRLRPSAVLKKPSAPLPPRSSPQSTTCSRRHRTQRPRRGPLRPQVPPNQSSPSRKANRKTRLSGHPSTRRSCSLKSQPISMS